MTRVAALGDTASVEGFALAGALVFAADDPDAIDAAWDALPDDVGVVILTPLAQHRLQARLDDRPHMLTVMSPG